MIPMGLVQKILYGVVGLAVLVLLMQQVNPILSPYGIVGTIIAFTIIVLLTTLIANKLIGLPLNLALVVGFLLAMGLVGLSV